MLITINSGTGQQNQDQDNMIAKIKGTILEKTPSIAIVTTGGIGFEILISGRTFEKLPDNGETVELDIYTHVREDDLRLVGFFNIKSDSWMLNQVLGLNLVHITLTWLINRRLLGFIVTAIILEVLIQFMTTLIVQHLEN